MKAEGGGKNLLSWRVRRPWPHTAREVGLVRPVGGLGAVRWPEAPHKRRGAGERAGAACGVTGPTSNVQSDIPQAGRLFRLSGTLHAQVTALQPVHELLDTEHGDAICLQLCHQIWVAFDIIVPTHPRVAPRLTVEVQNPPNRTSVNADDLHIPISTNADLYVSYVSSAFDRCRRQTILRSKLFAPESPHIIR